MKVQTKKTKIVATIGPASSSKEMLKSLIAEGVNVIRVNFSHGAYEEHKKVIDLVREINKEEQIHTALLADLQGPKIRIGSLKEDKIEIKVGQEITFTREEIEGDANRVYINYENFAKDVKAGENILIDDGKLRLEIIS